MCIEKFDSSIKENLPKEFYAWKVAGYQTGYQKKVFIPLCFPQYHSRYRKGINIFRIQKAEGYDYQAGCHLFIDKPPKGNFWHPTCNEKLIRVKVRKKDILASGYQEGLKTISVKRAEFPKYCGE